MRLATPSDWEASAASVKEVLVRHLSELKKLNSEKLVADRQAKFEAMGDWEGKE